MVTKGKKKGDKEENEEVEGTKDEVMEWQMTLLLTRALIFLKLWCLKSVPLCKSQR